MNIEQQHEKMLEDMECGLICLVNLEAILTDNGASMDVESLGSSLYKHTSAGVWLSVMLHDGKWMHTGDLSGIKNDNVRALLVGSIVEGSDAEVKGDFFDLLNYEDPDKCVADFNLQVEAVNNEACLLWEEQNGEDNA